MGRVIAGVILFFCCAAAGQDVEYLAATDRILLAQQGWGEMGINTCAHAPGQAGIPLQIKDRSFARGLGHHAPGEIIIELSGEYQRFEAQVGVQPLANGVGSVVFQVFVDDEKRFDSGIMRGGEPAKPVAVDLKGAGELRLVVTDAGDGINCDCANWADARLIHDPAAKAAQPNAGFEVGQFAMVVASDPKRMDGARSSRIQEYRAEDVFLEKEIQPDGRGVYRAEPRDGAASIGLKWIERRRIRLLALPVAQFSRNISADAVKVQFWTGESPYQGEWKQMKGKIAFADGTLTFTPESQMRGGTWKVRWILPADGPIFVNRPIARSPLAMAEARLRIERENPGIAPGVEIYNGQILDRADGNDVLTIRYCKPRPWQAERTVLRFGLEHPQFSIAVDDVLKNGRVYVPEFGVMVSLAELPSGIEAYRKSIAGKQTILQEVRSRPDQTLEQALARVHHKEQDPLPMMLSLAADNRKFIAHRDGRIEFKPPQEKDEAAPADQQQYPCHLIPTVGAGKAQWQSRKLDGGWLPAPVVTWTEGDVTYRMRSFVAPLQTTDGGNALPRGVPVCVAEFTVQNTGKNAADALVKLAVRVDARQPARIELKDGFVRAYGGNRLLAIVRDTAQSALKIHIEEGLLTFSGQLAPGQQSQFQTLLPGSITEDQLTSLNFDLWQKLQAHWEAAVPQRIVLPDPLLNNIIRASQVHCLIAARNEDKNQRIAPWIASVSYGPLESESNSIIRSMDLLGHQEFARRSLDYFIHRYHPAGYLTTGYTLMGTGWHLWTLGEHAQLARDDEWLAARADKIRGVCDWIVAQRKKTSGRVGALETGLMPPGVMADWNAFAYYFCLNGYYYAGLKNAAEALGRIGVDTKELLSDAADFRNAILRAYHTVQAQMPVYGLRNGTFVPGYPSQLLPGPTGPFFPGEDGNRSWCYDVELGAHHLVPQGVLPPTSPEVDWMMDHMEDVQFLADGWFDYPAAENQKDPFNLGGFSKVQPYYTRNGEIYAMRNDVKPFVRSYFNTLASLLNTETLSFQEHFHGVAAWNKTHETGYFLQQTRFMLIMEHGEELWLAPLVTDNWLKDGNVIEVKELPTKFGPVSYRIESAVAEGKIRAWIDGPKSAAKWPIPKRVVLKLRHPEGKQIRGVTIEGERHDGFDQKAECVFFSPARGRIQMEVTY